MAKKEETTAEELFARAKANGYQRGAHREKDSIRDDNKHTEKTKRDQDRFLDVYDFLEKGLLVPDIATVKEDCLGKGVPAPGIETVKDFLRFYVAISKGKLDKRSTVDSVNTYAEGFFAGFSRVTGTPTDKEERSEVYNVCMRTLTKEGLIVKKMKPKHNFGKEDLTKALLTLWTKDDLIFIHERNRHWVKNNRDPEHISFGAAGKQHAKLLYNDGAFLLPMAIADKALFGFNSVDDLWRQESITVENELPLRWNKSVEDLPILRNVTMEEGVTEDPMSKWTLLRIFRSTLRNAGYFCGSSIHQIRRYLGKKVDEKYTETERSQHITQSDPRVFGQSYVANCSSVDGQATFLGEEAEHDHIAYFQGLRKFREKGLPCELPAQIKASLTRDPKILELKSKVQQLEVENADPCDVSEAKKRIRDYRNSLEAKTLQQYQQDWIRDRRDWKIITRVLKMLSKQTLFRT
ncbi:AdoMet-dependent rRNA methyltransferase [Elaphomyces granulatus]